MCDPRTPLRSAGWMDGRGSGLTDTSNFLMQPFCNSREETGCSPFYPMNQHDPIFAYKPSQLSLLPLAPGSDGLIRVHVLYCSSSPGHRVRLVAVFNGPVRNEEKENKSEWLSELCVCRVLRLMRFQSGREPS